MKHSLFLRICQAACLLAFFFLLTHSSMILAYAKAGLSSWACSVLPVLLPFIILSKFWIYYDIPQLFYNAAGRALPSHRQAALCITVLLLGLSSGFPVGAIFVQHYYKEGILSKRAAEELLPLCSFISPMFLLGYVHPLTGYHGITWIPLCPESLSASFHLLSRGPPENRRPYREQKISSRCHRAQSRSHRNAKDSPPLFAEGYMAVFSGDHIYHRNLYDAFFYSFRTYSPRAASSPYGCADCPL